MFNEIFSVLRIGAYLNTLEQKVAMPEIPIGSLFLLWDPRQGDLNKIVNASGHIQIERTLNLRDSHPSSFFDVKQFVRQIQENLLSIKDFCHCPAVGQCLAVVWEQGMGVDAFYSDVGHGHCWAKRVRLDHKSWQFKALQGLS